MCWLTLLSRQRLGAGGNQRLDPSRTEFQRDYDRIVFSSAFRRLQDKTQVFPMAESDYVRTRLTHSLEVSSVGRTLGSLVGGVIVARHGYRPEALSPSDFGAVVAAACLAHDLGNPPFGHSGEDAIRDWFGASRKGASLLAQLEPAQQHDFRCFEGNAQGFRILTRLQGSGSHGGMQLTCATLAAFSKYPQSVLAAREHAAGFGKHGCFEHDLEQFREVARHSGLIAVDGCAGEAWHRHPLAWLVEAADDICYSVIDIEDGFRVGHLHYHEVTELLMPMVGDIPGLNHRLADIKRDKSRIEYLRAKVIGVLTEQAFQSFVDQEQAIVAGGPVQALLTQIPDAMHLQALKSKARERLYYARSVVEIATAGFQVLGGLVELFIDAINEVASQGSAASTRARMLIHLVPEQFVGPRRVPAEDLYVRMLGVTDFVSGMTDGYAVGLFKKMTGISLPGP